MIDKYIQGWKDGNRETLEKVRKAIVKCKGCPNCPRDIKCIQVYDLEKELELKQ